MNMLKKTLLLVCMMALVVCISVGATIAYLMDDDVVTNTFTVGQVGISLDEAKVNTDGTPVTGAKRVQDNEYHLLPGHTYTKDPTVHVDADSESCWLFVRVENELAEWELEANDDPNYVNIETQITNNGWKALGEDYPDIYYQAYTKDGDRDIEVFQSFKISGTADNAKLESFGPYETMLPDPDNKDQLVKTTANRQISVTAYAIQKDGFNNEVDAWKAGKFN